MSINFKRNYPIILLCIAVLSILAFVLGNERVIAYATKSSATATDTTTTNGIDYTNDINLFDDTVVHSIQVIMADEDYDSMITTYQETGLKEYFQADVIIDGVRINDVGIRLKGNASLRTALGGGMDFGGGSQEAEASAVSDSQCRLLSFRGETHDRHSQSCRTCSGGYGSESRCPGRMYEGWPRVRRQPG